MFRDLHSCADYLVAVAALAGIVAARAATRAASTSAEVAPGTAASAAAATVPVTGNSAAAAAVIRQPSATVLAVSVSGIAPSRFPVRTVQTGVDCSSLPSNAMLGSQGGTV